VRSIDMEEISLRYKGKPVATYAKAYGFKNIQNFVRKVKRKRCRY